MGGPGAPALTGLGAKKPPAGGIVPNTFYQAAAPGNNTKNSMHSNQQLETFAEEISDYTVYKSKLEFDRLKR